MFDAPHLLFTRDPKYLGALPEGLARLGGRLSLLPVLQTQPVLSESALPGIARRISRQTSCVFVSRTAIERMQNSLMDHCPHWPNVTCIALGPSSQQDLARIGVPPDRLITPLSPPYQTETLLEHPFFQDPKNIHRRPMMLFRGQMGRTALGDWLRLHGAQLEEIELYHRTVPQLSQAERAVGYGALSHVNAILITSADGLLHLMHLAETMGFRDAALRNLKQKALLVPSERVHLLAKRLGFTYIVQMDGLQDTVIINALERLFTS